jgi:hypothetical protein
MSFGSLVRFALLIIAVLRSGRGADHLLGWDAVDLSSVDAHEVLTAASHDIGLVGVVAQIAQHFDHRVIGELGRVKDLDSHSVRALLASRALLVKIKRDLENQIRGLKLGSYAVAPGTYEKAPQRHVLQSH